jgi:hypothetical protein
MSTPLTDEQLLAFSGEHLLHELSMLWELAEILPQRKEGTCEYVALIESFATHLRNLIEFLFFSIKGDYVRAQQFFDDPAAWSPELTSDFKKLLERANNEVDHLTVRRVDGNPPEKAWPTDEILRQLETVAKEFAAKASGKKLHSKVREFLHLPLEATGKWIADNVAHSNVTSHVVTQSFGNMSTATRLITEVHLK